MRHLLYNEEPKFVRDTLAKSKELAEQIHRLENELIELLGFIDKKRFYVRLGFKSLRNYCQYWLKFTKTQSQRIATEVRTSPKWAETHINHSTHINQTNHLNQVNQLNFSRIVR